MVGNRRGLCALLVAVVVAGLAVPGPARAVAATDVGAPDVGAADVPAEELGPDELCAPGRPGVRYGTDGPDVLEGTAGDDTICGLGGDDVIRGLAGADRLGGGPGADELLGGLGDDTAYGEGGGDRIAPGPGLDVGDGGDGDDTLVGSFGADELTGGAGADRLTGGWGDDTLDGGAGPDHLDGQLGADRVFGAADDDDLLGGRGEDLLAGEDGVDQADGGTDDDTCLTAEVVTACERGDEVLPSFPETITPSAPEEAGIVAFTGGPGLPGVAVEVDSSGGLAPGDIRVRPNRQATIGISGVAVSPAYDIDVADPAAVLGGRLTLPYDPARLTVPAQDLRIATFDPAAQLWVPLPGQMTVDETAGTVTAAVPHFSLFAVVQHAADEAWDADAIADLFGATPVTCVPADAPGVTPAVDVVFTVDTSGSMATNDPGAQRVAAAQSFLAQLRPGDRAAVVDFDSSARTLIGLTDVTADADRASVSAALDRTADSTGATNLDAAVEATTAVLAGNGGGGRIRVAVLLTDGESDYDEALTGFAAQERIAIYTVALGGEAGTAILQGIAEGTGGRLFTAATADQLPGIYDSLAGDIIDDGTDTDGDGLTDCEERTGLFSPAVLFLPALGVNSPLDTIGVFTYPDPATATSDADGTPDGQEVRRARFADDPELAAAFRVLVEAGRDTYFLLVTGRPDDADTDNDGLVDPTLPARFETCASAPGSGPSSFAYDSDDDDVSDGAECTNGTNPLVADLEGFGVPGLTPATLFSPARYVRGAIEFANPVVDYYLARTDDGVRLVQTGDGVLAYDEDFDCVAGCAPLVAWAAARDNGFQFCINGIGLCTDDADQIRDKVREVVEQQGVFDGDGDLRTDYIGLWATALCQDSFASSERCDQGELLGAASRVAAGTPATELDRAATRTLQERLGAGIRQLDPGKVARVAGALALTAKLYRDSELEEQEREETLARAVDACARTAILDFFGFIGTRHPCEVVPMFLPGEADAGAAARNDAAAIAEDPTKLVLQYASAAEREPVVRAALAADGRPSSAPRQWYRQYEPCVLYDTSLLQCDEYPYFASTRSGPPTTATSPTGARILPVPIAENRAEGNAYAAFTRCPVVNQPPRSPFVVVPLVGPAAAPTTFVCPR